MFIGTRTSYVNVIVTDIFYNTYIKLLKNIKALV